MRSVSINILFFLTVLFATVAADGQVLINPQLPVAGLFHRNQLWNIQLISNYNYSTDAQLQMIITDMYTGKTVLTAMSAPFSIYNGAKQIKQADLEPIQYSSDLGTSLAGNAAGILPAGKYTICYSLIASDTKTGFPVSEACVPAEIEPLAPPQLITPADTSWVESRYPGFTWLPPSPAAMVPELHYEILLAEMKEGQNAYDAIQKNTPVYTQRYLSTAFLLYPSSAQSLEPGKRYAWQVIARNGAAYAHKTEAWSFQVTPDTVAGNIDGDAYPALRKGYDAYSYTCRGNIKFEYNNETGDSLVKVTIYEWQGEPKRKAESREIRMKPGQNFIEMETGIGKYKSGQQYLIEIINNRKEIWNLKFKYVRN